MGGGPGSAAHDPTKPASARRRLGELSSADLDGLSSAHPDIESWCLLIPLGSTEQHGPHLPLSTDTIIATEWAKAAAQVVESVLVAPPLPYGSSGEHRGFPGTLSIGRSALRQFVAEIARSAESPFSRIVLVSGHGGNHPVLEEVVDQLRLEGHNIDWIGPVWPSSTITDAHAGLTETSLMLHLRPDLVGRFEDVSGNTTPLSELMPVLVRDGLQAATESGVLGDPRQASAAQGRRLFTELVDTLVSLLSRNGDGDQFGDHQS